jgi:hypothetical protein
MNVQINPYQDYFDRGGKITKCPTMYAAPVTGADNAPDLHNVTRAPDQAKKKRANKFGQKGGEKRKRIANEQREKVCRDYLSCPGPDTVDRLAGEYAVHRKTIHEYLRKSGIIPEFRRAEDKHTPELDCSIADFYLEGWSREQCAKADGVTTRMIDTALRRNGIKLRYSFDKTPKRGLVAPDRKDFVK